MSGSRYGEIFSVMTFGESHGPYIGLVIDGVQPGIEIDEELIQKDMDRRRPGQSDVVTPRKEDDRVQLVSGVFEGKSTGTPICILIKNKDQRSRDYGNLKTVLRPGHANYTFLKKYGIFDYRGGGRASGRETACRVAAGAIAKQLLSHRGVEIFGFTRQIGEIRAETVDPEIIEKNIVRSPDPVAAEKMIAAVHQAKEEEDSLGGVVEVRIRNCPIGLGEPVFHKLDADMAGALMSIGAVKGFEVGAGFKVVTMHGSESNDSFKTDESGQITMTTNNSGGLLGGISSGEELIFRIAVKPPSSIGKTQQTVDREGKDVAFQTGGRHDPCICPRVVPVAEAMAALVLIDHLLMQERIAERGEVEVVRDHIRTIDHQILLLLAQRGALQQRHQMATVAADSDWDSVVETLDLDQTQRELLNSLLFGKADDQ